MSGDSDRAARLAETRQFRVEATAMLTNVGGDSDRVSSYGAADALRAGYEARDPSDRPDAIFVLIRRFEAATSAVEASGRALVEARRARSAVVRDLLGLGFSVREAGRVLSTSHATVQRLASQE